MTRGAPQTSDAQGATDLHFDARTYFGSAENHSRSASSSLADCGVITFDPSKRGATLRDRGLDFPDAELVFAVPCFSFDDDRVASGEQRIVTVGLLAGRMVIVIWTPRSAETRHVISMRKANDREQARHATKLG